MSDKIITEEILWEMLEEKGIKQPYDTGHEDQLEIVLRHWDATITEEWTYGSSRRFYVDNTADGYEVYVASWGRDSDGLSVSENIYYYENGWLDELPSAVKDGVEIYFSELSDENYQFVEKINELYEQYFEDKVEELQDELLSEGWLLPNDVVIDA